MNFMYLPRTKSGISVGRVVIVVVIVIIIIAAAGFLALRGTTTTTSTNSSSTTTSNNNSGSSTSSSSASSSASSSTSAPSTASNNTTSSSASSSLSSSATGTAANGPSNSSQLTFLAVGGPNTMDPAGAFSSEETLVVNNVYQELFIYNYTSTATLVPVLATQYSSNPTATSYNFVLQPNAYFMNGDAFNASVVWFNFYRVMVMNQIGGSFFSSLLYNATSAFSSGYVLPTGADAALVAGGYQLSTTNSTLRQIQASTDLAALLSHFNPSNSTIQKIMSYSNQSV